MVNLTQIQLDSIISAINNRASKNNPVFTGIQTLDNPSDTTNAVSLTIQNSGVTTVAQTTGINFKWITAISASIKTILRNFTTGASDLVFATSPTGLESGLINRLVIDSLGRVTTPTQPSFRVTGGAAESQQNVIFSSTSYNIGNHFNTSTGIFTAPIAGRYQFNWNGLHGLPMTIYVRVLFKINGSANVAFGDSLSNATASNYISTSLSQCFYLNAGDSLQLFNEGNRLYNGVYNSFSGYLVG